MTERSDLAGRSYLSRSPFAADVWAEVERQIPADLLRQLTECVFVMLKPDALAAHEHSCFRKMLTAAGLDIVQVWPCLRAEAREYEELYKFNLTLHNEQNMLSHWWLTSRQFQLGHSLALLVRVPPGVRGPRSAYECIADLKGPSNPYLARAGQLRYDLRATNLALNMVHCSDDPLSTAREALIFGDAAVLTAGLRRAAALSRRVGRGCEDDEADLDEMFEQAIRALRVPRADVRLVPVLTTIKIRIRSVTPITVQEATEPLYREYRIHGDREDMPVTEAWRGFEFLSNQERDLLASLAPTDRASALLRDIADVKNYDLEFSRKLAAEVRSFRLPLSPWEELVLDTSFYYGNYLSRWSGPCAE